MPGELTPLSPSTSYFDLFGVPVAVDEATLTRRFRELSRLYHPDRWANADPETQTIALDASALLNDAYRTLRDPFRRAEYLLRRESGVSLNDLQKTAKAPQELFARVLELQEALMEYQEARLDDDAATLLRLRPELDVGRAEFSQAYDRLSDQLQGVFEHYDGATDRAAALETLAGIVGTRGYLRRVLTNLDGTLV